jgi:3-hydroxyisobutyrate dehydrogenase
VAVLGTGIMGAPIARNLARAGLHTRAWNRTRSKAEALAPDGVTVAATPAEAAASASVLVTMLADADAVEAAMSGPDGALAGMDRGTTWIQMSTVGVRATPRLASLADEAGVIFVDAPVLGTKQPAERGELLVLASGPAEAEKTCEPVFAALAKTWRWVGPTGAGTRLKLVANSWVLGLVELLAETFTLAERMGVEPQAFLDAIAGGPVDVPYAHVKGEAMIKKEFPASFPLALALKDARLITEAAEGAEPPLLRVVREQLERAVHDGHGDLDLAGLYLAGQH